MVCHPQRDMHDEKGVDMLMVVKVKLGHTGPLSASSRAVLGWSGRVHHFSRR